MADCAAVVRRFAGPRADELAVLCRPDGRSRPAVEEQARAAYGALAAALSAEQGSFRDLAAETLFLRDIRRDLPRVLAARTSVLEHLGQVADAPTPAFIEQAPLGDPALLELAASAVVPRDRNAWSTENVPFRASCPCEGCALSGARLTRLGDQISLQTANLYGAGGSAPEQVAAMFHAAQRLLEQCGMSFRDVVRTWIHLRDIDRDYDALNVGRREFFENCGIEQRPASTGVQGSPLPDAHDFSLSFQAIKSDRPADITQMSTPTLNEAWSYGADFARGLRVVENNGVTLHVSGTASIDEAGETVHVGDLERQAERMLDNIETLLAGQGATFDNVMSAVLYLKHPADAPTVTAICNARGFHTFPTPVVHAPLCRPALLCEAELAAKLPRGDVG